MDRPLLVVLACFAAAGCGAASLTNPVVVHVENAQTADEYDAALATSRSQGYSVVVSDSDHHALLLKAKPVGGATTEAYFGIQALPGTVAIFVEEPAGHGADPVEARVLERQMEQLAQEIGQRTLSLGEPSPGTYAPPALPLPGPAL